MWSLFWLLLGFVLGWLVFERPKILTDVIRWISKQSQKVW